MTDDNLLIEAEEKIARLRHALEMILLCDADVKAYRQIARYTLCECDCVSCVTGDHDGCYYAEGDCWKRSHPPVAPAGSAGNNNSKDADIASLKYALASARRVVLALVNQALKSKN